MANNKSAIKRIRTSNEKRLRNRYLAKTTRNAVDKLRNINNKKEAEELLPKVISLLDKTAKKNIIHKNKTANLKGKLASHVNSL
ncbi:MAG: 30S ribosomal protein S20 [Bacteroidota bacterium]